MLLASASCVASTLFYPSLGFQPVALSPVATYASY